MGLVPDTELAHSCSAQLKRVEDLKSALGLFHVIWCRYAGVWRMRVGRTLQGKQPFSAFLV